MTLTPRTTLLSDWHEFMSRNPLAEPEDGYEAVAELRHCKPEDVRDVVQDESTKEAA